MFVGLEIPKRYMVVFTMIFLLVAGSAIAGIVFSVSRLSGWRDRPVSTIVEISSPATHPAPAPEKAPGKPAGSPPRGENDEYIGLMVQLDLCWILLKDLRDHRPRIPARPMDSDEILERTELDRMWDRKEDEVRQECLRLKMMAENAGGKHGVK